MSPAALSRRAALRGSLAAPLALAVGAAPAIAALATADVDPVFATIERHRAALAAYEASFDESTGMVAVPPDVEGRQQAAGDVEAATRHAMHRTVPTTLVGLRAYTGYWSTHMGSEFHLPREIGWEAVATIAEATANLLPEAGA